MKVGAIIQARMGSTRLPGKIMMKLPSNGEHSILKHIIIALKKSKSVDFIVLATSHEKEDDVLESFAKAENILFSRGSSSNVLQRFYETNVKHGFDHILRVTADNPFVDYELIDQSVKNHLESGADYSKTIGLPVGMNLEVFSKHALDATMEATDKLHMMKNM